MTEHCTGGRWYCACSWCSAFRRERQRERSRAWNKINADRYREYQRGYRERNRERLKEGEREYRNRGGEVRGRWSPAEDRALLTGDWMSHTHAAHALGRSVRSVNERLARLRAKGLI